MTKQQLELRHQLYDILTNPGTLYMASNDHIFELESILETSHMTGISYTDILIEASNEYLAKGDDGE